MANEYLAQLLAENMRLGGLSTRDVAAEADVAHTTIARILRHRSVSVTTLRNIARYLNVDPGNFLSEGPEDDLSKNIAALIGSEPALASLLGEAARRVEKGEISPDVLREIVRYAAWRIDEVSKANAGTG